MQVSLEFTMRMSDQVERQWEKHHMTI